MKMPAADRVEVVDVNEGEVEQLLAAARAALDEGVYKKLSAIVRAYIFLLGLLQDKTTSIKRLRKLAFGSSSEKTREVFPNEGRQADTEDGPGGQERSDKGDGQQEKKKRKGHGRNGAAAYRGADRIAVPHATLKPGDNCPECIDGKVYRQKHPAVIVRVVGQAPLAATLWELERLRCNLCGKVFTAEAPEGVGERKKYDESAVAMIALLRYGAGTPFYRLAKLQKSLGVPAPDSTQWDIVYSKKGIVELIFNELVKWAANGRLFHNDDTTMKVLSLMLEGKRAGEEKKQRPAETDADGSADRNGIFTTGIVALSGGHEISLFFTGHRHAGENLRQVLLKRAGGLSPPIQMCDALSRNVPKDLPPTLQTILANCNSHARRRFVDVAENFPDECLHVLQQLSTVYKNDEVARQLGMTDEHRLLFHQLESGAVMGRLKKWMKEQLREKKVEPNSGLGEAMGYTLKHWHKLVLFLKVPGAPIDNNIVERSLKKLILLRKNSLFYKTENGARVGDMYMSLIHTAELCGANPFDYLVAIMRHADAVANDPGQWMPWNYTEALHRLGPGPPVELEAA
jgi:transposase